MSTATDPQHSAQSVPGAKNLRFFNTLTGEKEAFQTVVPGKVSIYQCGPTVYKPAHIGHMVGPVIYDSLKRFLTYCGFDVTFVVNITDVDDKIINQAQAEGTSTELLARRMTEDYIENLQALGVDQIDHMPTVTENMDNIIAFIEGLIAKDFAYAADGDVFFEVSKCSDYGKLSNRSASDQQGEGGGAASKKRSASDFALWKGAKEGEPSWESPWGPGRPGWHIECSAMCKEILGETIDIHGGGLDLVFPHHENEIAQSECLHAKPMVKYWIHNGLMQAADEVGKVGGRATRTATDEPTAEELEKSKISKSTGAGPFRELRQQHAPETIRFLLLATHYRSPIYFSSEKLAEVRTSLDTFYRFFKRYHRITGNEYYEIERVVCRQQGDRLSNEDELLAKISALRTKFLEMLDDDFNTGAAVGELFEIVRLLNKYADEEKLEDTGSAPQQKIDSFSQGAAVLAELSGMLGLFLAPQPSGTEGEDRLLGPLMELVIQLRAEARTKKDFATADQIRDALSAANIVLEDRPSGTEWTATEGDVVDAVMQLIIRIRQSSREKKDFATADQIRDALSAANVVLEDRAGGTEWSSQS